MRKDFTRISILLLLSAPILVAQSIPAGQIRGGTVGQVLTTGTAPCNYGITPCGVWSSGVPGASTVQSSFIVGSTAVVANELVKFDSSGHVIPTATSDTSALGIAETSVASGGTVVVALLGSPFSCVADNSTTVNDLITVGTTTAATCRDTGTSVAGPLSMGRFLTAVSAGSVATVFLYGPGHQGIAAQNTALLGPVSGGPGPYTFRSITNSDLPQPAFTSLTTSGTSGPAALTEGGVLNIPQYDAGGAAAAVLATSLQKASNLSDVASPSTARTNLGLGTIATQNSSAVTITGGTLTGVSVNGVTPSTAAGSTTYLNGAGGYTTPPGTGGGTVDSVALTAPTWLAVSGSPVTNSGTLAITAATSQTSHQVIGTCGTATSFAPCALVAGDIPTLNQSTTGNAATATLATTATNLASGALGSVPYQSGAGATAYVASPTTAGTYLHGWTPTGSAIAPIAINLTTLFASPAFTGVPTVPTATAGTSTTQAASTAFVENAIGSVATSFSAITSGTNSVPAAMLVGSGSSLGYTSTGIVNANQITGVTVSGTAATNYAPVATTSSAATWQAIPLLAGPNLWGSGVNAFQGPVTMDYPTTATSSNNYPSSLFSITDSYWNGTTPQSDIWQWQLVPQTGTNPQASMILSGGNRTSGTDNPKFLLNRFTSATSSTNFPAISVASTANIWNGSASVPDPAVWTYTPGTGTNPGMTYALNLGAGGSTGTHTIVFGNPFTAPSVNAVLNPTSFSGSDIGAQINSAQSSSSCTGASGCVINVPPASYTLSTGISITNPNVTLNGYGVTLTGNSGLTNGMINISGSGSTVKGFTFATNGALYGIIAGTGINQSFMQNSFGGAAGVYIAVSGSPSGMLVDSNTFNGATGCAGQSNISIFLSAHVDEVNNRAINTCGFNTEVTASSQVTVENNHIRQDLQTQSLVATSGQTSFTFTWPSTVPTIQRVWVLVGGVQANPTSVTYTSALVTTVVLPAQTTGTVVTAMGWTALENIQVNSQSFNVTVANNTIDGGGDAGIDVVSDYHLIYNGSQSASQNQQTFTITASPGITATAVPLMNNRILTPDKASLSHSGSVYTITLLSPVPAGTLVALDDLVLNQPASAAADFPAGVTIQGNTVKNVASVCIAPEIAAQGVIIQGNVVQDCDRAVLSAAFSAGIFTAGAQVVVKNNIIQNTLTTPSMAAGISVQCPNCETGAIEKTQIISGNTYMGTFANGKLFIPALAPRQSGIDVSEGTTIPYPEQINIDQPWTGAPPNTHYFTYSCSAVTRGTTGATIGGVASFSLGSSSTCTITPTEQIFFYNSIMRVTFWAFVSSGSPYLQVISNLSSTASGVAVFPSGAAWKQYTIDMPTQGLDTPPVITINFAGNGGSMNLQGINISATPITTGATSGTGSSSGVTAITYSDAVQIGSGAFTVYRCTTAGTTIPIGTLTTLASDCGSSVATTLTIN